VFLQNLDVFVQNLDVFVQNLDVFIQNLDVFIQNLDEDIQNLAVDIENLAVNLQNLAVNIQNLVVNIENLAVNAENLAIFIQIVSTLPESGLIFNKDELAEAIGSTNDFFGVLSHRAPSHPGFYPQMTQIDTDVSICVHLRHLRISLFIIRTATPSPRRIPAARPTAPRCARWRCHPAPAPAHR